MTRPRRATLSDVATRAGVSRTTASYVLNGRTEEMRIAADTEQRVLDVIAELSYRPNLHARSLRTKKTSTIGVITDYIASGIYSSPMLSGANFAARAADHLLVIGESEGDQTSRDLLIEEMLDRQVDGIIYATRTALRLELPTRLRNARVVLLNCYQPGLDVPSILPDDRGGGRTAAETLLAAGIDSQVYVVGEAPPDGEGMAGPERLAGVMEALADAGAPLSGVVECEWDPEPAYAAVKEWLGQGAVPRGLVCMNDRAAFGTYRALAESGLRIPDDVSVVSFDGTALAAWSTPPLSSVALPLAEMGALAVRLVLGEEDPRPESTSSLRLVPMPMQQGGSVRSREVVRDA